MIQRPHIHSRGVVGAVEFHIQRSPAVAWITQQPRSRVHLLPAHQLRRQSQRIGLRSSDIHRAWHDTSVAEIRSVHGVPHQHLLIRARQPRVGHRIRGQIARVASARHRRRKIQHRHVQVPRLRTGLIHGVRPEGRQVIRPLRRVAAQDQRSPRRHRHLGRLIRSLLEVPVNITDVGQAPIVEQEVRRRQHHVRLHRHPAAEADIRLQLAVKPVG